ncbi:hypothetical protein HDA40_005487 [Hamadaea flava]|uniref:Uncharacterized protein n=1 Tax=Hamadaea flava TaxID=1742688 RepID=A0ABV8LZ14_9ACTN|nr:hypothetical protein [Hamadaea flava]MCP2326980.1 hypothetical protein [Hamadaea flava]
MLTVPIEAADADPVVRVLAIGRSENVLTDLVAILRTNGHAAGATNEFDRVLDLFDVSRLDVVVFGGMVPPDTKAYLREQITNRNAAVTFVQGYAGIPGLVAMQVEAAVADTTDEPASSVTFDAGTRTLDVSLAAPRQVTVVAWWHTSFTPPEPRSTSRVLVDTRLSAGRHDVAIPEDVPAQASFATVSVGPAVHTFIMGAMPTGTTMARFPGTAGPE